MIRIAILMILLTGCATGLEKRAERTLACTERLLDQGIDAKTSFQICERVYERRTRR